jgi:flagellar hook-associated protein 3 FlgL
MRNVYDDLTGTNGGTQADLGNQITALQSNMGSLEAVEAQVGATTDRMSMASMRITNLTSTDQTQLGNVEDTDMATASVQYSTEQAGYQAALQSTAEILQTSLMSFLQS